jgi:hypothetical protein
MVKIINQYHKNLDITVNYFSTSVTVRLLICVGISWKQTFFSLRMGMEGSDQSWIISRVK